jgi:hypothetical protein
LLGKSPRVLAWVFDTRSADLEVAIGDETTQSFAIAGNAME